MVLSSCNSLILPLVVAIWLQLIFGLGFLDSIAENPDEWFTVSVDVVVANVVVDVVVDIVVVVAIF